MTCRSETLVVSGPDNTLTITLPANDSEGWAVYGGRYLCRASNGYSTAERLIVINVVDIPSSGTLSHLPSSVYLLTIVSLFH